jgi:hypothetical protein
MAKAMKKGIPDYDFVAFSDGCLLNSINTDIWKKQEDRPTREQLESYRKYLTTLGMDPETIIDKANNGQKTVIIDFCGSGSGMRAFLEILRDWALEQNNYTDLKESVIAVPMYYPKTYSKNDFINQKKNYCIYGKQVSINLFKEFNASPINLLDSDIYEELFDIFDHNSNTFFEKFYPSREWENGFPTRGPEKEFELNSNLAKFAIIDFLARKNNLRD